MKSSRILFIADISLKKQTLPNGVNIKNKHLLKYLTDNLDSPIKLVDIADTYKWKKYHLIKWFLKILIPSLLPSYGYIILSLGAKPAYQILKLLHSFNLSNKVIYFVVGGALPGKIKSGKYDIKYFESLKSIFVETSRNDLLLKEMGLENSRRVYNFKHLPEIQVEPPQRASAEFRIFYLGRIHAPKGIDLVFDALGEVNQPRLKYLIDFYGPIDEGYRDIFLNNLKKYPFSTYKGILDIYTHPIGSYQTLAEYDFSILATHAKTEGFPGSIIDSFISGVPIIISDWNYNTEFVKDKNNGYIFLSQSKSSLIDTLNTAYENRFDHLQLRRNARKSADKFNINVVLSFLLSIIR